MDKINTFIKNANKILKERSLMQKEALLAPILGKVMSSGGKNLLSSFAKNYAVNLGLMSAMGGIGSDDGFLKGVGRSLKDPTTHLMTLGSMAATPLVRRGTALTGKVLEQAAPKVLKPVGRSMRWFNDPFYRASRSKGLVEAGAAPLGKNVSGLKGVFGKLDDASKSIYEKTYKDTMKALKKQHSKSPMFTSRSETLANTAEDLGTGFMKEPISKFYKNTDRVDNTFKPFKENMADEVLFNPYAFSAAGMGMTAAGVPVLSAPAQALEAAWSPETYKGILNTGDQNRFNQWYTF